MTEVKRFSPSRGWDEVRAFVGRESGLLTAIAGVFFLLPAILVGLIIPDTPIESLAQMAAAIQPYLPLIILTGLVQMTGQIAIWTLFLGREKRTVGEAILFALKLLPFYFVANLLASIAMALGLLLLLVPGIWVFCRLYALGPVMAVENVRSPLAALRRSFALSRGNAFPIFGFVVIIGVVYLVILLVTQLVLGGVLGLAGLDMQPGEIGALVLLVVESLVSAAGATVFALMQGVVYRSLAGDLGQTAETFR